MATVDIFTAPRMKQIEDTTVVNGLVDANGNLLLATRAGEQINAGSVRGPAGEDGAPGPAGESTIPAGSISLWPGETAPANWLICDGSAVSRTTYATLFSVVGTKYGVGDGSTTFNLPNLKGRTPVGKDSAQTEFDTLGETGGAKTHTLTEAQMPAHSHGLRLYLGPSNGYLDVGSNTMATADAENRGMANTAASNFTKTGTIASTGSGQAHNILQPYQVVNFIIKFTAGESPGDSELTQRVSTIESGATYAQRIRDKTARLQRVFTGGGARRADADGIAWTDRFITIGTGRDEFVLSGYFDIQMPANGTVIPVYHSTATTSVTVANGKIPMPAWGALYYRAPLHGTYPSVASRFFIMEYRKDADPFVIYPESILVCARNDDPYSPLYTWGDGQSQDYWKDLGLANGWANYDAGGSAAGTNGPAYAFAGWRLGDDGKVHLRGLIRSGNIALIASLNAVLGPDNRQIFTCLASGGIGRVDVFTSAAAEIHCQGYHSGGTNAWVDLSQVSWFPKDY